MGLIPEQYHFEVDMAAEVDSVMAMAVVDFELGVLVEGFYANMLLLSMTSEGGTLEACQTLLEEHLDSLSLDFHEVRQAAVKKHRFTANIEDIRVFVGVLRKNSVPYKIRQMNEDVFEATYFTTKGFRL